LLKSTFSKGLNSIISTNTVVFPWFVLSFPHALMGKNLGELISPQIHGLFCKTKLRRFWIVDAIDQFNYSIGL